ncbi:MAG: DUF4203 domain-containing protein [Anaerolineaceae bacterium]|nr:MAG: DUF4203 domain-containing protein [Anaerolineaceae bacterium]
MVILQFLLNLLLAIVILVLGGYILFVGRRALWATLGIISLASVANLLAVLVAGVDSGRELMEMQAWFLVGIAVAAGVLGVIIGHYRQDIAIPLIGVIAGASASLWLYDIAVYVVTDAANMSEQVATIVGLVVILIGALFGLWLMRYSADEALILISMIIGADLIQDALRLSRNSSWTAIIILSLALAGVLVQYANYLREIKSTDQLTEPVPAESSLAYFQDLELAD